MKPLICLLALVGALPLSSTRGATLFENSFELPEIFGRIPKAKGGDFARQGTRPDWRHFEDIPNADATKPDAGGIVAGLTTELARTGNQSCFIDSRKLATPYAGVTFMSRPFRVLPGKEYVVGVWGRSDAKTPLVVGTQQLYLKIQADFFSEDSTTQTGESNFLVQAIPGTAENPKFFTDSAWRQLSRRVTAPEDAKFMMLSLRVESGPEQTALSGVFYIDDVSVVGDLSSTEKEELAALPDAPADPSLATEAAPAEATPAPEGAVPAPDAAAPAPAATPAAAPAAAPAPAATVTPEATAAPSAARHAKHKKKKGAQ